ncbi:hypothetical protein DK843_10265 [Chromobacterium phragmitis]|uniref:Uncharacterized protein n=2 Tax=Chromobacterium phragmitis TaxID=2202141 RepID=A0A344UHA0_9NEIS|nr:hypothetical protein DK843_10265 [Chromobacterium phragmitis]
MPRVDFRNRARESLARAKTELSAGESYRLRFAALELRMAIEAVTYDRTQAYESELPSEVYRTWQPKKLMQQLLDLEPMADQGSSIAVGREETPGVAASQMQHRGTEQVFDMKAIKAHYDALGSFLHTPTLKQLEEQGDADFSKLQTRCEKIIDLLEGVLSSRVFNITLGIFSNIECMNPDCGKTIRRRIQRGADVTKAECFECGFTYEIQTGGQGQCIWRPILEEVPCPSPECTQVFRLAPKEIAPDRRLHCHACGGRFQIGLALFDTAEPESTNIEN